MAEQIGVNSKCIKSLDGLSYTNSGRNLKVFSNFEEFLTFPSISNNNSIWGIYYSGAGASVQNWPGDTLRPGIAHLITGTTNTGYASYLTGMLFATGPYAFGAGQYTMEGDFAVVDLSTAAEEYSVRLGWNDAYGAGTDGIHFLYDRTIGLNWLAVTISGGVPTITDTGIPVIAGTWFRLKIVVNPTATAVQFFINGVLVATNIANIPSGAGRDTCGNVHILKSVGATSRSLLIDWIWSHFELTITR